MAITRIGLNFREHLNPFVSKGPHSTTVDCLFIGILPRRCSRQHDIANCFSNLLSEEVSIFLA